VDKGKGKDESKGKGNTAETLPVPLCGVPIGAGLEGTSHLPPWGECPLRRDLGALAITMGEGEGGVGGDHGGEKTAVVMGSEVEGTGSEGKTLEMQSEGEAASVGGQMDGADEDDGVGRRLFPPTPRRRHSAAT